MGLLNNLFGDKIEQWTGLPKSELIEWQNRAIEIKENNDWFTGQALKEVDDKQPADKNGDYPLVYPLQINPIATAARLHSFALWGEVPDTADTLVRTIVDPDTGEDDEPSEAAVT